MDGCLACKSCTGQCPIKVNVPAFRVEVLRALLRPLSAPAAGLRGRRDRAPRAADGADAGPLERACRTRAGADAPADDRARRHAPTVGREHRSRAARRAASRWPRRTRCAASTRPSAPAASWSCRTPSPATTRPRSSSISRPDSGARLPALAGAVPPERQGAARAWLPRCLRAHCCRQRGDAAGACGHRRRPRRSRSVDDANLPVRVCRCAG